MSFSSKTVMYIYVEWKMRTYGLKWLKLRIKIPEFHIPDIGKIESLDVIKEMNA